MHNFAVTTCIVNDLVPLVVIKPTTLAHGKSRETYDCGSKDDLQVNNLHFYNIAEYDFDFLRSYLCNSDDVNAMSAN